MDSTRKVSNMSDIRPLNSPASPYDNIPTHYDSGDLGMQYNESGPYSPPLVTPRSGAYLTTPTSTFETGNISDKESLLDDHAQYQGHHDHHNIKRFDHNEARKQLLKTGSSKLGVTVLFSVLLCICLKAWEGFGRQIVLSKVDVCVFNAVMIGLSLCLGLNLLSSLKHYANTFRWSFLARRYVSLETFDLILHASSLIRVTKLMFISMPGLRNRKYLRRLPWFRDVRGDGTKWMWLVCLLWLAINIGSQILVALLSLFWPVETSLVPLLTTGNVTVADMRVWHIDTDRDSSNATSMEAAWSIGTESNYYPEFAMNETQHDLSTLPGTPLYHGNNIWEYRFFNRDPDHQYTNYILSGRKVQAETKCEQLEVRGGVIDNSTKDGLATMYIEGRSRGAAKWTKHLLPEQAAGSVTWIASVYSHCGARCTNFTVLQDKDDDIIKEPSLFLCNSTLSEVSKAGPKGDIVTHTDEDRLAVYGTDNFARIATGAIAWTGIDWNGWKDRQTRSYSHGSRWSPSHVITTKEVEDLLMRFTAGAVAAFDDHGIRYNVTDQRSRPSPGQRLDVDWPWVFTILGGICGIQLIALFLLAIFANRTIIRDESFLGMAMLLNPVVAKIGRAGMNLSGEEIKNHPKLKWKKIRYDYREGKDGEPNQVDIFFEGKDQKEGRKSWAAGAYS